MLTGVLFVSYTALEADGLFRPISEEESVSGDTICIAPEEEHYYYQDNHSREFYEIIYPKDGPGVIRDKNGEVVEPEEGESGAVPFVPRTGTPRVDMIPPGNFFNGKPGMFNGPGALFPYLPRPSGKSGGNGGNGNKGNCSVKVDSPGSLSLILLSGLMLNLLTMFRKKV